MQDLMAGGERAVKALLHLHVRWWHRGEAELRPLLERAGVPEVTLSLIPKALKLCRTCRKWAPPPAKPIARMELATNHLDVDMRDALALALQTYGGAIVLVAHDRDLMDKLVDEFWLLDGGRLSSFSGDMGEYVALKKESVIEAKSSQTPDKESKRELRQSRAKERQRLSELSDQVKSIESDIEKQQAELARVEGLLADKETYNRLPAQELSSLLESSGRLRQELAQLEDTWLNVSRLLEKEEEGV